MVDDNFVFKGGKHSGKSYGLVRKIDPSYISWCEENAPGMLKEKKSKPVISNEPAPRKEPPPDSEVKESSIKPNTSFWNEGPHGKLE